MAAHYDAKTRTVGDQHDWQMVLLDTRRNRYLFCVSGNDFSLAGDHLCLRHGRGLTTRHWVADVEVFLFSCFRLVGDVGLCIGEVSLVPFGFF